MNFQRMMIPATILLASTGCVAGPGGSSNAANRAVTGIALGSLLGGVVGAATGTGAITGVAVGAFAGGAAGAAMNPRTFDRGTRGYCYTVDQHGNPIVVDMDAAACKAAGGAPAPAGR
jgi:hypothetical protein